MYQSITILFHLHPDGFHDGIAAGRQSLIRPVA